MKILSIETSCDETGISILEVKGGKKPSFKVLADSLSSQIVIHAPYGGVYPMLAKREHIKNLPILLEKVLKKSKIKKVDLIAVTTGPGLEPALWTGIVFAKELAEKWGVPLIPVNHMEGHVLSVFGKNKGTFKIPQGKNKLKFPVLSLLVSGGHTELVLVKDWMKYKVIGQTLDDAAGEAFDKVARMLGLPYPGGPEISKLAEKERRKKLREAELFGVSAGRRLEDGANFSAEKLRPQKVAAPLSLPRPMLHSKNFDFSFSGLKTAVLYLIRKIELKNHLNDKTKAQIAMEFENAVIETLIHKTKKAIEKHKIETLIIAGGVSANKYLRKEVKKNIKNVNILFPEKKLTTDNSIMIGIVGYLQYIKNKKRVPRIRNIKASGNLSL